MDFGFEILLIDFLPVLLDVPDCVDLVDELVRADLVLVEPPVGVRLHRELERLAGRRVDEPDLQEKCPVIIKCL